MIRVIIWALFYAVMIPLIGLIGIPWTLITGKVDWMYNAAMWAAFTGARIVGANVHVRFEGGILVPAVVKWIENGHVGLAFTAPVILDRSQSAN